jgi:hypothetical protein
MKYFYYIITIEENKKYYSHVARISDNTNLKNHSIFNQSGIISITPCSTLKEARFRVNSQNEQYMKDNVFMFSDGPLF